MEDSTLLRGEQIYQLIPQRKPIVMVDKLYEASLTDAETGLTIERDNLFVQDERFREPGLIEHIAQSAAAFAGYDTFQKGLPPRLGFIGEVKKCRIYDLPKVGAVLRTHLHILGEVAGVTLLAAQTFEGEKLVAEGQMKIFLEDEK